MDLVKTIVALGGTLFGGYLLRATCKQAAHATHRWVGAIVLLVSLAYLLGLEPLALLEVLHELILAGTSESSARPGLVF